MPRTKPIHMRVKAHVESAGMNAADLARATGWHYLRTLRLLNGTTHISANDMEVIARVIKKPVADLYKSPEASS